MKARADKFTKMLYFLTRAALREGTTRGALCCVVERVKVKHGNLIDKVFVVLE